MAAHKHGLKFCVLSLATVIFLTSTGGLASDYPPYNPAAPTIDNVTYLNSGGNNFVYRGTYQGIPVTISIPNLALKSSNSLETNFFNNSLPPEAGGVVQPAGLPSTANILATNLGQDSLLNGSVRVYIPGFTLTESSASVYFAALGRPVPSLLPTLDQIPQVTQATIEQVQSYISYLQSQGLKYSDSTIGRNVILQPDGTVTLFDTGTVPADAPWPALTAAEQGDEIISGLQTMMRQQQQLAAQGVTFLTPQDGSLTATSNDSSVAAVASVTSEPVIDPGLPASGVSGGTSVSSSIVSNGVEDVLAPGFTTIGTNLGTTFLDSVGSGIRTAAVECVADLPGCLTTLGAGAVINYEIEQQMGVSVTDQWLNAFDPVTVSASQETLRCLPGTWCNGALYTAMPNFDGTMTYNDAWSTNPLTGNGNTMTILPDGVLQGQSSDGVQYTGVPDPGGLTYTLTGSDGSISTYNPAYGITSSLFNNGSVAGLNPVTGLSYTGVQAPNGGDLSSNPYTVTWSNGQTTTEQFNSMGQMLTNSQSSGSLSTMAMSGVASVGSDGVSDGGSFYSPSSGTTVSDSSSYVAPTNAQLLADQQAQSGEANLPMLPTTPINLNLPSSVSTSGQTSSVSMGNSSSSGSVTSINTGVAVGNCIGTAASLSNPSCGNTYIAPINNNITSSDVNQGLAQLNSVMDMADAAQAAQAAQAAAAAQQAAASQAAAAASQAAAQAEASAQAAAQAAAQASQQQSSSSDTPSSGNTSVATNDSNVGSITSIGSEGGETEEGYGGCESQPNGVCNY